MGVLHLDVAVHRIQDTKLEIITSEPLINYRETVKGGCEPIMAKSPNRHNKIFMKVEPLNLKLHTCLELVKSVTCKRQDGSCRFAKRCWMGY